jgi:hypothetical protein
MFPTELQTLHARPGVVSEPPSNLFLSALVTKCNLYGTKHPTAPLHCARDVTLAAPLCEDAQQQCATNTLQRPATVLATSL